MEILVNSKTFELTNVKSDYTKNLKLVNLRCKHVFNTDSLRAKQVLTESLNLGYTYCKWGTYSGNTDSSYHLSKIIKQEKDNYNHAIRIVIAKYDFSGNDKYYWTDNLHSTIKYIRQYGFDTELKDIPYYVVDLSSEKPVVVDVNNSVRKSFEDIQGAINSALARLKWSNSQRLIDLNYTVKDFLLENMMMLQ